MDAELNARLEALEEQGQKTLDLMEQILVAIRDNMSVALSTMAENVAQLEETMNKEQDTGLADEFARLVRSIEAYPVVMKKTIEDIALVNGFAVAPD